MDQHFEYVRAVDDPVKFIRENAERTTGLRALLHDMHHRKRVEGKARDHNLLNQVSPSAYQRSLSRKRGEVVASTLERETEEEKDLRKRLRLNDQKQRIPGSYKSKSTF